MIGEYDDLARCANDASNRLEKLGLGVVRLTVKDNPTTINGIDIVASVDGKAVLKHLDGHLYSDYLAAANEAVHELEIELVSEWMPV